MKCPKCAYELASADRYCVNCGYDVKNNVKNKSNKWIVILLLLIIFLLIGIIAMLAKPNESDVENTVETTVESNSASTNSIAKIYYEDILSHPEKYTLINDIEGSRDSYSVIPYTQHKYFVTDVNSDGLEDLVVQMGLGVKVFSYIDGAVKEIYSGDEWVLYESAGVYTESLVKYKGTYYIMWHHENSSDARTLHSVTAVFYSSETDLEGNRYINDKQVSDEEYNNYVTAIEEIVGYDINEFQVKYSIAPEDLLHDKDEFIASRGILSMGGIGYYKDKLYCQMEPIVGQAGDGKVDIKKEINDNIVVTLSDILGDALDNPLDIDKFTVYDECLYYIKNDALYKCDLTGYGNKLLIDGIEGTVYIIDDILYYRNSSGMQQYDLNTGKKQYFDEERGIVVAKRRGKIIFYANSDYFRCDIGGTNIEPLDDSEADCAIYGYEYSCDDGKIYRTYEDGNVEYMGAVPTNIGAHRVGTTDLSWSLEGITDSHIYYRIHPYMADIEIVATLRMPVNGGNSEDAATYILEYLE